MKYLPEEREVLHRPSIRGSKRSDRGTLVLYPRNKDATQQVAPPGRTRALRRCGIPHLHACHATRTQTKVRSRGSLLLCRVAWRRRQLHNKPAPPLPTSVVQSLPNHFIPILRIFIRARVSPLPMASQVPTRFVSSFSSGFLCLPVPGWSLHLARPMTAGPLFPAHCCAAHQFGSTGQRLSSLTPRGVTRMPTSC